MSNPLVSVIMASYNHADYIEAAVESVIRQDYEAWELLIADDASTDNTLEVLKKYTGDTRIKVFPFKINRQFHMRNAACAQARGKYIAFLNSDDLFLSGKLSEQVATLEANSATGAVFTHVRCIDDNGDSLAGHWLETVFLTANQTRHRWLRTFIETGNCLCISSAMVRGDLLREVGFFNPQLIQVADLELWIKTCLRADIEVITETLTAMRIRAGGKNLHSASPTVFSRLFVEYQLAYGHYFLDEALHQLQDIFPEIPVMPQDDRQLRLFLLCQKAAGMRHRHIRLAAFHHLHNLLADAESKQELLRRNPRLMRNFFLSEGAAGLHADGSEMPWQIAAQDCQGVLQSIASYWTADDAEGTLCLSIPNPKSQCRLLISNDGSALCCRGARLYEQETGNVIYTSETCTNRDGTKCFSFPMTDFAKISSRWLDIEIDTVKPDAEPIAPPHTAASKPEAWLKRLRTLVQAKDGCWIIRKLRATHTQEHKNPES